MTCCTKGGKFNTWFCVVFYARRWFSFFLLKFLCNPLSIRVWLTYLCTEKSKNLGSGKWDSECSIVCWPLYLIPCSHGCFLRLREKVLIRTSADSILKLLSSHPLDLLFAFFGHKTCRFIKTPRIDVARGLYLHILLACLLC